MPSVGEHGEQLELSNTRTTTLENCWAVPMDVPKTLHADVFPMVHVRMLTAALLVITRNWKQPNGLQ